MIGLSLGVTGGTAFNTLLAALSFHQASPPHYQTCAPACRWNPRLPPASCAIRCSARLPLPPAPALRAQAWCRPAPRLTPHPGPPARSSSRGWPWAPLPWRRASPPPRRCCWARSTPCPPPSALPSVRTAHVVGSGKSQQPPAPSMHWPGAQRNLPSWMQPAQQRLPSQALPARSRACHPCRHRGARGLQRQRDRHPAGHRHPGRAVHRHPAVSAARRAACPVRSAAAPAVPAGQAVHGLKLCQGGRHPGHPHTWLCRPTVTRPPACPSSTRSAATWRWCSSSPPCSPTAPGCTAAAGPCR